VGAKNLGEFTVVEEGTCRIGIAQVSRGVVIGLFIDDQIVVDEEKVDAAFIERVAVLVPLEYRKNYF
jgi:hypothetical protein